MQMGRILSLATLAVILLGEGRAATATTYIFATFKGDDAAGMKLSIYTSTDSINFTLLSDTGFGGNTSYIRDPSIMKYTDGKYYIAYTDPMSASCCNPEDHFGIAVSADLIHWTDLTTVKAGVPSVSRTWAPEWYIEAGMVRIIANIDTGNQLPDFQPYAFTAQNSTLTSWSGPTALGIGADYIDTFVAKLGTTYHAFIKSETTRYLEHATAPSLTGPWTFVGRDNWAGWGSGLEGPAIVQLDDGKYRMYVDPQSGGTPYQYMTSSDLNTWSAKASIPGAAGTVLRHGTVIRDEVAPGLTGTGGTAGIGGSTGTGGATGTGGSAGTGGFAGSGGSSAAGGSTARGGSTGTGGSTNSGGTTKSGGSTANGGSTATGGSSAIGGSTATGGSTGTLDAGGGAGGGAGTSAPATGGRGGSGSGGVTASGGSAAIVDAGIAAGGSTSAGGSTGGGGGAATPDAGPLTGGTSGTGGASTVNLGGSGGTGTTASTSANGGASGLGSVPDAAVREATNSSGCSCSLNGRWSATPTSVWLALGLVALVLTTRRRRKRG